MPSADTPDAPQARAAWGPVSFAALGLSAAIAAFGCFREIFENDTGWHLALGRVYATQGLRFENALSWTAPHFHWYPTSWLYDWCTYVIYARLGVAGIQGFTCFLMLLVIGSLAVAIRVANSESALFILPAIIVLELPRLSVRPHVASWVVATWALACGRLGATRDWRWRLAALPIIAVGINMHAGAALGTAILGLFCIEAAVRERHWLREGLIATGAVLALFATPSIGANVVSLREHLHLQDVIQLMEYRPPEWKTQPGFFLFLPIVLVLGFLRRRSELSCVAAAAALAYMAFPHGQRFVYEFFLVAAVILADATQTVFARRRELYLAGVGALAFAAVARDLSHSPMAPRFDPAAFAVRATRFIQDEGLGGRFFNSYHDGGYLALMLPENPVYIDSRPLAYPDDFLQSELKSEVHASTFQQHLRDQGIEWAVTGAYAGWITGQRLLDSPDWALVYWDEVSEVFLRRDVPRFAEKIARLEFRHFTRTRSPSDILRPLTDPSAPATLVADYLAELDRFDRYTPDSYMSHLARCLATHHGTTEGCAPLPDGSP
jgi:hypothetical protein